MWKYIKPHLPYAVIAGLFMFGEVLMDLIQPGIMSRIVDDCVLGLNNGGTGNPGLIWRLGIQMIGLVLFGGMCGSLNNVFVHMSAQNVGNDMRKDCFRRVMQFSFPQLDEFGTGSLVTRVTNDITQVQNFVAQLVRGMIRTLMLTFGSMFCIFRLNRDFGLVTLCAFPFIAGCLAFCLSRANPLFSRLQAQLDSINGILQEDIAGIRTMKACVREVYEKVRFGKANDELIKTQLKVLVIFAFMNPVVNAMMYIVVAVILLIGSYENGSGAATPGNIMAAVTYTTQLLNGILMLNMLFQNISRGFASWKRVKVMLNSEPELKDGAFCGEFGNRKAGNAESGKKGEIEFRDVSFSYPRSGQTVLEHLNLTIHPGEKVAILGATGCGKTSLVNLIPRFYDVTEGAVLVDGVDVREYNQKALREKVAVVLQKSELFSASIEENIAWGNPDASSESVKAAAITAQADSFISSTSEGYGTMVAERGMSLSGGQKQRISIARAILKPAEILILDDSTSALDLKTESDFYSALQEFSPKSTKIIIAQRIASVRGADRIIVLENGRISGSGTHGELLKFCGAYQEIYRSQMGGEDENHG
ncbi:MAG TPA: multidrug ABC transporter ATP-binding protein [Lachnospiraceae bacterium]|nr:multidrug ABC transporter ATP-binding protein [Lachnospiraceae bacterium]